ncbi:MAG: Gfo/Idh/MocA family oxidoreductase, partial [Candidatus Bathyarchaeota archaeon]|nr:Gfo/Idh/MocA family oxidoreductase [Candidatus Bathyarchaeota archaeon]
MVSSRKAKMGLVGCGGIGKWHLKAAAELQEEGFLQLAAVCDLVKAKAREMGEIYHAPYFTDLEKMLGNDLDFIDICTGDYTHHTVAKLVAEHGKHVLIEKPMAITLPCCDVIIDSCRRAGVYYEVAENYYRTPSERAMKKIIERGIIGDVLRTYAIDPAPANSQSQSPFSSHSPIVRLLDMGSHRMSEIREFSGSEAETIIGVTKPQTPGGMYDDWGHAVVEFENGAIGVCELALGVVGKTNYREVIGTKGTLYNACRWAWGGDIQLTLRSEEGGKPIDVPVEKITRDINGV